MRANTARYFVGTVLLIGLSFSSTSHILFGQIDGVIATEVASFTQQTEAVAADARGRELYLDAMKRSLLDLIYENDPKGRAARIDGTDWPSRAMTMIGQRRLDNLETLSDDVIANDVAGDMIETGAWRGGATIFMRAILKSYGVTDRVVWVADSFEGLPPPNPRRYPADAEYNLNEQEELAVSLPVVRENFRRYDLLDDQVRFLKGWFKDTLPDAPIKRLAILRLDGDLYESTMDALVSLYPKLSIGGYIIVDDYGALEPCRQAVHDYRQEHGITEPIK